MVLIDLRRLHCQNIGRNCYRVYSLLPMIMRYFVAVILGRAVVAAAIVAVAAAVAVAVDGLADRSFHLF